MRVRSRKENCSQRHQLRVQTVKSSFQNRRFTPVSSSTESLQGSNVSKRPLQKYDSYSQVPPLFWGNTEVFPNISSPGSPPS